MKCSLRVIGMICLLAAVIGHAQGPEEQYVRIYSLIQEADTLNNAGRVREAMAKYAEAQAALSRFPNLYPGWNEKVVNFRLNYIASKLAPLTAQFTATNAVTSAAQLPDTNAPTTGVPAPSALVRQLQEDVQRLQADNERLAAKLKEALSVQPSAVDPLEITRAEEKNRSLQKENALLRVSLSQEQAKTAQTVEPAVLAEAQRTLTETRNKMEAQARTLNALQEENELLKKQVAELEKKDTGAARKLSQQLEQSRTELTTLQDLNKELRAEKTTLESRVADLSREAARVRQLETQLAAAQTAIRESEDRIRQLEKDRALLQQDRNDLQSRLTANASDVAKAELKKRQQLEEEVADLRDKLAKAETRLSKRGASEMPAELQKELVALQARLAVLEAQPVPFTPAELAALRKPAVQLAASSGDATAPSEVSPTTVPPTTPKKIVKEPPPGAGALAAAAQSAFLARRFDEAEDKYKEVLRQDEDNVFSLGNLAAIQIEMNKLDEAEKHLTKALSMDPTDEFCLYLMGRVKFQRGKMDEALDLLSQAAKANPDSAETQNYLGIVLSEKGLRAPAETAFRKAIQLQPNYAAAHNNLAFIYATQKPSALALARWHYQKALEAGHPKNPDLEKLLSEAK